MKEMRAELGIFFSIFFVLSIGVSEASDEDSCKELYLRLSAENRNFVDMLFGSDASSDEIIYKREAQDGYIGIYLMKSHINDFMSLKYMNRYIGMGNGMVIFDNYSEDEISVDIDRATFKLKNIYEYKEVITPGVMVISYSENVGNFSYREFYMDFPENYDISSRETKYKDDSCVIDLIPISESNIGFYVVIFNGKSDNFTKANCFMTSVVLSYGYKGAEELHASGRLLDVDFSGIPVVSEFFVPIQGLYDYGAKSVITNTIYPEIQSGATKCDVSYILDQYYEGE